jgi:hypothetical protein
MATNIDKKLDFTHRRIKIEGADLSSIRYLNLRPQFLSVCV